MTAETITAPPTPPPIVIELGQITAGVLVHTDAHLIADGLTATQRIAVVQQLRSPGIMAMNVDGDGSRLVLTDVELATFERLAEFIMASPAGAVASV
jgi:hypothetical protein